MISDNGTTLGSAPGEIRELTGSNMVLDQEYKYGTTWKLILQRAHWYGGFLERLAGLTKQKQSQKKYLYEHF